MLSSDRSELEHELKVCLGYKSIDKINLSHEPGFNYPIQKDKRGKLSIAVVDDQTFEAGRNLKNYGYVIIPLGDLNDIKEVEGYSIVLCDLMGVGIGFDDKYQGASLIREIRQNYPATVVAAYTGSSTASDVTRRAKWHADKFIQKDADLETWVEELDNLISTATNPKKIWQRTRVRLVEEMVPTKQLLLLEDAYVRSINCKDNKFIEVENLIRMDAITSSGSDIIKGVISSAIFALLMA